MKGNKLFKIIGAVGYHARNKLQLFWRNVLPVSGYGLWGCFLRYWLQSICG